MTQDREILELEAKRWSDLHVMIFVLLTIVVVGRANFATVLVLVVMLFVLAGLAIRRRLIKLGIQRPDSK